jgi:acylphosphatase
MHRLGKNNWDDTVTMEIQGEEDQIDQVILSIDRGRYVRIENMEVRDIPIIEQEYGFRSR